MSLESLFQQAVQSKTGDKTVEPLWRPAFNPLVGPVAEQGERRHASPELLVTRGQAAEEDQGTIAVH